MYSKLSSIVLVACMLSALAHAENPIVPDVGFNDPHIHIFNDKAYVYATHDKSIENENFIMEDSWIWSSTDLVQADPLYPSATAQPCNFQTQGSGRGKEGPYRAVGPSPVQSIAPAAEQQAVGDSHRIPHPPERDTLAERPSFSQRA